MKYRVDASMEMITITAKFLRASLMSSVSLVPRPRPKPRIGPIRGEMSIAPMMTGIELRFNPTEAMIIAQARMKTLGPRNGTLPRMAVLAAPLSMCSDILTSSLNCLAIFATSNFISYRVMCAQIYKIVGIFGDLQTNTDIWRPNTLGVTVLLEE